MTGTERISLTNILKIIMRYDHFMRLVRMKVLERGRMLVGEEHMGLAHALVQHGYNQNNVLRVPHIHRATLAAKKIIIKSLAIVYDDTFDADW